MPDDSAEPLPAEEIAKIFGPLGERVKATFAALTERAERAEQNDALSMATRTHLENQVDALTARVTEAEAEREKLQDRLDMVLPPLTADREAIMGRLDEKMTKLTEDEQGRAKPFLDRREAVEVIQIARHMLRYANDAESGNAALRESLAAAEHRIEELTAERDALERARQFQQDGFEGANKLRIAAESQVAALSAQVEAYRGALTEITADRAISGGRAYVIALAALSDKEETTK